MKTEMIETTWESETFVLVPWIAPHHKADRVAVGCAGRTCGTSKCQTLGPCNPRDVHEEPILRGPHVWIPRETYEFRRDRGILGEYGYGETPVRK